MALELVDPVTPSIDELDAIQRAQLGAIEVMVRAIPAWDGKYLAVSFSGEEPATRWIGRRGGSHVYDAWIYGGGTLVVFAAGDTTPLAWDFDGLDGADGFSDYEDVAAAVLALR